MHGYDSGLRGCYTRHLRGGLLVLGTGRVGTLRKVEQHAAVVSETEERQRQSGDFLPLIGESLRVRQARLVVRGDRPPGSLTPLLVPWPGVRGRRRFLMFT